MPHSPIVSRSYSSLGRAALAATLLLVSGAKRHATRAAELDTRPLALRVEHAYPQLKWTGWNAEQGVEHPLRPILLTHAGDGSEQVYAPEQRGVIYRFANRADATSAERWLDLTSLIAYHDKTNEEGLLGLAFHPKFRENGRFYVYYTNQHRPHQNVVAGYKVDRATGLADPRSAEILLTLDKPFWNHDGGTIVFGPDGYLYIAVGDGGMANDPQENGQKLSSLLGKILRIDIDRRESGKAYAIPADNPFRDRAGARGEIFAYGLRNVWRMAFDRETGLFWAGDVGQDIWEEIDLIVVGGNYGWNRREGQHSFAKSKQPSEAHPDLIEPIFEYHHDLGKSITGGFVYRGQAIPELRGAYLYADYVAGRLWALWYDPAQKQVTANREIPLPQPIPVMSLGEDAAGEAYLLTYAADGQGIWRLNPAK